MKIHVLYDKAGRIRAAVQLDGPDVETAGGELRPVAKKGETSGDFEVPPDYAGLAFIELCQTLRVDTKQRKLVAKGTKSKS
jgi:hypothetical protein